MEKIDSSVSIPVSETGFWRGLVSSLSGILGRDIKEGEVSLEKRLNDHIAAEKAKFRLTEEDVNTFCVAIGDTNPIHRSARYAKMYLGLKEEKIVVPGNQLYALGEEYINTALREIDRIWGAGLNLAGSSIKFKEWVHPGDKVHWQVVGYEQHLDGVHLKIEGRIGRKKGNLGIQLEALLLRNGSKSSIDKVGALWSDDYTFTRDQLNYFYQCIGEEPRQDIPWSYLVALITASMLDKSMGIERVPEGVNREMKFRYNKKAEFGNCDIDDVDERSKIGKVKVEFFRGEPVKDLTRKGMGYKSTLDVVCSQYHTPLITGRVIATTKRRLVY